MAELSISGDGIARENLSAIFQALSEKGQGAVAQVMGVSDSSMSRWKSDEIPVMAKFLTALELNVYPNTFVVVDPAYLAALRTLARVGLETSK
jgi:hypothetical protein